MTGAFNHKTSRLDDQDYLDSQEIFTFATDESKYSINENITSLGELQTLSDLASQLQNASGSQRQYLTDILNESQTLLINSLTDNLDDSEKSEAAELIANIITMNPYPKKIFLEDNDFSGADLTKIISAVLEAKADHLLQTDLHELHLRGTVSTEIVDDIAKKLLLLGKRAVAIDLDHDIQLLLTENESAQFITSYQRGCENYLHFLEKLNLHTPAVTMRQTAITRLRDILETDATPASKKETFDAEYQQFKSKATQAPLDPREATMLKKIIAKSNSENKKGRAGRPFFAKKSPAATSTAPTSSKKLKF